MSHYHLEPLTSGKVVFSTNFGDIDLELWPREAPLACRNFIQLALEGYYDGTLFHRIIKNFMVQGGDPTGVGDGGESVWGKPFKDEFHSRLRFTHRGLLAMANPGKVDANESQFFLTLDACEWLAKKHTIFGKVSGETIFNLLRMGDMETDAKDRPVDPPRLDRVTVLSNPFDDIVPRNHLHKTGGGNAGDKPKLKKKRDKVKNKSLLSFGDEEEGVQVPRVDNDNAQRSTRPGFRSAVAVAGKSDDSGSRNARSEVKAESGSISAADHSAAPSSQRPSGSSDPYKELQRRMLEQQQRRQQMQRSLQPAKDVRSEEERSDKPGANSSDETGAKSTTALVPTAPEGRGEEKCRDESRPLELSSGSGTSTSSGDSANGKGDADLLESYRMRQLALRRKRDEGSGEGRQSKTMSALAKFKSNLTAKKRRLGATGEVEGAERSSYHGQVLEVDPLFGADNDAGDSDWFSSGKLKFKAPGASYGQ